MRIVRIVRPEFFARLPPARWQRAFAACLVLIFLPARGIAVEAAAEAVAASASGGLTVSVTNPLGEARPSETISLPIAVLRKWLPGLDPKKTVVVDNFGVPVLSQWVDTDGDEKPDELVFQVNLAAHESKAIVVKPGARATATREQYRVYGRFVRERHDDFAWENDRIAHRMYGPDLETWKAEPLTSSGIDVWCKRVRRLVVNDWYLTDDYHRDGGEGGDFYSVGRARGCGGLGIWSQGKLAVSRNFVTSRVLANGPIRLIFELTYAPWDVGAGRKVSEIKRVTLDAGQSFDHLESTFHLEGVSTAPLAVGIGIARHEGGELEVDRAAGWVRSWEPLKNTPRPQSLGCAIVTGAGTVADAPQTALDQLLIVNGPAGEPLRYDAGFGWDGNGDFANRGEWNRHVDAFVHRLESPVRVDLSALARPAPAHPRAASSSIAGGVVPAVVVASGPVATPLRHEATWAVRACDSAMTRTPVLAEKWSYESGLLLKACLEVGRVTQDPKYFAYVRQAMDPLLDDSGRIRGYKMEDYNLDNINMGKVLFPLLAAARDASDVEAAGRYTKALEMLRAQLRNQPRTSDGGFWHKLVYPRQMWLDGVYMASPFLAQYASVFHEPALLDEAVHQVVLAEKHLRDPRSGLLYHGWDETRQQRWANAQTGTSPEFWGRAVGWYAMAVVDVLAEIPGDGSRRAGPGEVSSERQRREPLLGVLRRLADALARVQDPTSGVWWQVLNAPRRSPNYEEASASSMIVYALSRAVNAGWLDEKRFGPVVAAGFRGIVKEFVDTDASGMVNVRQICRVAGLGGEPYRDGSFAYYTSTEVAVNDPKGVAPFILASTVRE